MSEIKNQTLFDRIGGMNAVDAAVDIFYRKVVADHRVNEFFKEVNVENQSGKMKAFLAYAFGAPLAYTGKDMREAHAHMDLSEDHFNAVSEILVATLEELSVPQKMIDEVVLIALSTREDVLGL